MEYQNYDAGYGQPTY